MKCPKCGYLGFEPADRCRNCSYEFALASRRAEPELSLREQPGERVVDDLDLIDASAAIPRTPAASPSGPLRRVDGLDGLDEVGELPLFNDDVPLITKASPPRPPLAVRRATPEVPRLRSEAPRTPPLSFQEPELEMPFEEPVVSPAVRAHDPEYAPAEPVVQQAAGLGRRFFAAAVDLLLLALVDLSVIYFTIQICGLTIGDLDRLPVGPLLAFLVVQNGGYLVAFTAGGQTIGKMLAGIRVVASEPGQSLDLGRALQRTLLWTVMALPAGLGLLSALLSDDRRGLHDRFSGTRVIRVVPA